MEHERILSFISDVVNNMPSWWLSMTTHRLDIYDESLAKVQFLEEFEKLYVEYSGDAADLKSALNTLPTAYDYIRLGHPLSCVLEWGIAKLNGLDAKNVISFSSMTIPVMAILRKNLLDNRRTKIIYLDELPECFDVDTLRDVYGYSFELQKINSIGNLSSGVALDDNFTTVFVSHQDEVVSKDLGKQIASGVDFIINNQPQLGSILIINGDNKERDISSIQHVRRRETIAMTPADSLTALKSLLGGSVSGNNHTTKKSTVLELINKITSTKTKPLVASSGLSIQYAILMGLIHDAKENHTGKPIKIIVPTNCYGGTNDQARRVAACLDGVEVVDLAVDGDNDMVSSIESVLTMVAEEDAIPYIIAEIPTNPRVEVPNLIELRAALSKVRKTVDGNVAVDPVFILDQTFCPNVHFLGEGDLLSSVRTISFSSGSKFPSGGKCTAGYCVGNEKAVSLIEKVEQHLKLCDNEATELQYEILATQMPSMNQRIIDAYENTREFVSFVEEVLPEAKINFVSEELAAKGFTPSVFSLDLPTKGDTEEEREKYKRNANLELINMMITEIPNESKFCVSYGQLKGCYWTIPATSTQGTTKEGDKDYIVRASLSPNMDLEHHKKVFLNFVAKN